MYAKSRERGTRVYWDCQKVRRGECAARVIASRIMRPLDFDPHFLTERQIKRLVQGMSSTYPPVSPLLTTPPATAPRTTSPPMFEKKQRGAESRKKYQKRKKFHMKMDTIDQTLAKIMADFQWPRFQPRNRGVHTEGNYAL